MTKERKNIYLDVEHLDMIKEISTFLELPDDIQLSPLIRIIIAELHTKLQKEPLILTNIKEELSTIRALVTSIVESEKIEVIDNNSSDRYRVAQELANGISKNRSEKQDSKVKIDDQLNEEQLNDEETVRNKYFQS